jgi:hypothetical protein
LKALELPELPADLKLPGLELPSDLQLSVLGDAGKLKSRIFFLDGF